MGEVRYINLALSKEQFSDAEELKQHIGSSSWEIFFVELIKKRREELL